MDGGGFVEGRAVHFVEISVLMAQFPACRGSWSLQRRIEILNEARTRPLGMVLVLAVTCLVSCYPWANRCSLGQRSVVSRSTP
jgi:hypothetical protein